MSREVKIRCNLKPGDIGLVLYLHGVIYATESGYNHTFEAYVAESLAEFAESYNPDKDRLWIAEANNHIVGSIGVVSRSETEAQLRWLLVHPNHRGKGLGRTLLKKAIQFCRKAGYERVYLWTVSSLNAAINLYKSLGFRKSEEKTNKMWGKEEPITEEKYELKL